MIIILKRFISIMRIAIAIARLMWFALFETRV